MSTPKHLGEEKKALKVGNRSQRKASSSENTLTLKKQAQEKLWGK